MGNKGPVRYRKYTEEFKVEAIRLAESVGVKRLRIHSSIGYKTPVGAESRLMSA